VAIAGVLRDTGLLPLPLPQNARQIPQAVLQRGLASGGLQFGFELGTGVRTFVPSSSPYVLLAALLLSVPSPQLALLAGVGFATGRALTAWIRFASRMESQVWHQHLTIRMRWAIPASSITILATLAIILVR
jgi:hypothetical protein